MKNNIIRKITIGKDYKNDAMHYAVDQEVYGGHKICDIIEEEDKYGHVSIDVTDGSLTEIKEADEQADKKD